MKTWLNTDEAATYLGLSKNTIYHFVCERRIPFVKMPGSNQVRFSRDEIDQWMMSGRVETADEALSK